ncbi:hypothetical protein F4782DRAFT_214107 [Xylaria castorea]|nr:hypothetical protein F4782DRAFT_214107 [Xylaria castorea]
MPDQTQRPTEDEMEAEYRQEDGLRAREAALMRIADQIGLGRDGSIVSLNAWARLHHDLDLPQLSPSETSDLHESIFNCLISERLFYTAAALHQELADRASHHGQKKKTQESSTAGQTSVLLESHELLKDNEQKNGEGSHASGRRSLRSAVRPKSIPKPKASMATKAKECAAKVFKGPDNQSYAREAKDTANEAETSARLSSDDKRPLISSNTRAPSGEPSPRVPNKKKR